MTAHIPPAVKETTLALRALLMAVKYFDTRGQLLLTCC
jgi:hypothetical protein